MWPQIQISIPFGAASQCSQQGTTVCLRTLWRFLQAVLQFIHTSQEKAFSEGLKEFGATTAGATAAATSATTGRITTATSGSTTAPATASHGTAAANAAATAVLIKEKSLVGPFECTARVCRV